MDLAAHVYELSRQGKFARDFALSDQIHRAGISVPANVAEGFERGSRAEFHRFLSIAKGSCGEVRTHLHLAKRLGYLDDQTAAAALTEAEEVSRIISKLRTTVAKQRDAAKQ
ncbi:MAG TPA: four helix bundle protein [Thermoanaerobaculia bacterium]|nr:four helix bundle protein [Thermoanaerobaculia bacterium]